MAQASSQVWLAKDPGKLGTHLTPTRGALEPSKPCKQFAAGCWLADQHHIVAPLTDEGLQQGRAAQSAVVGEDADAVERVAAVRFKVDHAQVGS